MATGMTDPAGAVTDVDARAFPDVAARPTAEDWSGGAPHERTVMSTNRMAADRSDRSAARAAAATPHVRRWLRCIAVTAALPWAAVACEEEPTSIDDLDTVITLYDSTVDFGAFLTYAMPDSIIHIGADTTMRLSRHFDPVILDEIAAQMSAAGYVRVADPRAATPDVVVLAGVTSSTHVAYATYPVEYWDWWYGWDWWAPLDASWGFYYPWYPSTVTYIYRTGTLLIDMIDPRARDDGVRLIGSLWVGALNGLLDGNDAALAARIQDGIGRAFVQSPYLRANGAHQ
jgi:hypothetical protein